MQAGISVFSLHWRTFLLLPAFEELPSIAGSALKTRNRQSWDSSKHTCICTAGTGWQARHSTPADSCAAVPHGSWGFLELALPQTPSPWACCRLPTAHLFGRGAPSAGCAWVTSAGSSSTVTGGSLRWACLRLPAGRRQKGSELPTAAAPRAARDGSTLLSGCSLSSSPDRLAVLFLGSPRQTLCLVQLWLRRAALSSVYPQYPVCLLRPCTLEHQRVSFFLGRPMGSRSCRAVLQQAEPPA